MKYIICGSVLHIGSCSTVADRVVATMRDDGASLRIATVNPDFLLRAWRSQRFAHVLAQADVHIVDGVGITLVARCSGRQVPRYAGADLVRDLLAAAQRNGWHVHIFCRRDGLSRYRDVAQALAAQYPSLRYSGQDCAQDSDVRAVAHLHDRPVIYLCTFGAPQQEYFLEAVRATGARGVFVGVGGALDFITGKVRRAPTCVRHVGLEWLWRTWQQPHRIGKMIASTVVFPAIALWCVVRRKG